MHLTDSLEAKQQTAELVLPGKDALDGAKALLEDGLIEALLATTLAIGTGCINDVEPIPRVASIGAKPQKGAQVGNRMLKTLTAETLTGLLDKVLDILGSNARKAPTPRTGARQETGNRAQVLFNRGRRQPTQINEVRTVL